MEYIKLFEQFSDTGGSPTHQELSQLYWFKQLEYLGEVEWITKKKSYSNGSRTMKISHSPIGIQFIAGAGENIISEYSFYPNGTTKRITHSGPDGDIKRKHNFDTIEGWNSALFEVYFNLCSRTITQISHIRPSSKIDDIKDVVKIIINGDINMLSVIVEELSRMNKTLNIIKPQIEKTIESLFLNVDLTKKIEDVGKLIEDILKYKSSMMFEIYNRAKKSQNAISTEIIEYMDKKFPEKIGRISTGYKLLNKLQ